MLLRAIPSGLLPPRAARLCRDVMLLLLPARPDGKGPIRATIDGARISPPCGTVAVETDEGPRYLAAFRPDRSGDPLILLEHGEGCGAPLIAADFAVDMETLANTFTLASRRKVLSFLLGFCRTAFRAGGDPAFAGACAHLASAVSPARASATPLALVLPGCVLVEAHGGAPSGTLYRLDGASVSLSRFGGARAHAGLFLVEAEACGGGLLEDGEIPTVWSIESARELPHLHAYLQDNPARRDDVHGACAAALVRLAGASAGAASLLRELQLLSPATPRRHDDPSLPVGGSLDIALADGGGGLFLSGRLRDPHDLIARMFLYSYGAVTEIEPARLRHVGGEGRFIAHVEDPSLGTTLQPRLVVTLRSGASINLVPGVQSMDDAAARDAILASVPEHQARPDLLRSVIAVPVARLHKRAMARPRMPDVVRIGRVPASPDVSIVIPLYRTLGFLRFQVAAFAEDPQAALAEIVYVLDSPEQRGEVEHLLRGLAKLTGLGFTLVVMPRNLGFAGATNAGAGAARGRELLLLNSDVVPLRQGWLAALRAGLTHHQASAAGPKMLFEDGSIQHAGLYFERDEDGVWFNRHYHKGMPRLWPAAARDALVPGVTGGAMLVRRDRFEAHGGICEDYVVGDYEDSDFCLGLQFCGERIAYCHAPELYHFERRSIRQHAGYGGTLACLYNRYLHHERWDTVIERVMALHGGGGR